MKPADATKRLPYHFKKIGVGKNSLKLRNKTQMHLKHAHHRWINGCNRNGYEWKTSPLTSKSAFWCVRLFVLSRNETCHIDHIHGVMITIKIKKALTREAICIAENLGFSDCDRVKQKSNCDYEYDPKNRLFAKNFLPIRVLAIRTINVLFWYAKFTDWIYILRVWQMCDWLLTK